ncbi:MAG: DEAD/DEAH box helicase family protein [Christensenellaceae bacterium]|jgi:type III restriction enzyme|nr:DEAD/DEAH box helicase family protein [Christensenellaceae bacterium]
MELTTLQQLKVNELLALYNPTQRVKVDFKAPTGSGKTLMASCFISSLIEKERDEKFLFVIATPSSSSLPEFFEKKINIYKKDLPYSKFDVEYIPSPSSAKSDKTEYTVKILPQRNKVYIFGKSSFGKGRILSERNIIKDFVVNAVDIGYSLVYIRDEAHIGDKQDNSEESKQFEAIMQSNAKFILKMTATPNYADPAIKRVILKEKDLNSELLNDNKFLLKTSPQMLLKSDMTDTEILNDAITNFKLIKGEYKTLSIQIRPCMLIQIDNSSTTNNEKQLEFESALQNIKTTLTKNALSWVHYFGNNDKDSDRVYKGKFTLDDITQNDNEIDCVLFKIGPSTGWDIPRACMLVRLRNVCSASLNTQTIGRIKRNPYPNLVRNEITDKYYIYSNTEHADNDFKVFKYSVKPVFTGECLATIKITNKVEMSKAIVTARLKDDMLQFLERNRNVFSQEYASLFENGVYKKIRETINGNNIYSPITNPFIFLKEYKRMLNANMLVYKNIETYLKSYYTSFKDKFLYEFFITLLFEKHKREIADIVNKNRTHKPQYRIECLPYDSSNYIQMYDINRENKLIMRDTRGQPYLFDIIYDRNDLQPLDSMPEDIIFEKISNYADDNLGMIKVWAKNLSNSNINGEYIDENNNTRHSYFDYIIKFSNGLYLYIEVKSIRDIDVNKTILLKKAYADYFKNEQKTLFDTSLVICICKVDDSGTPNIECFYDENMIRENLNELNLRQLLSKLANLKI